MTRPELIKQLEGHLEDAMIDAFEYSIKDAIEFEEDIQVSDYLLEFVDAVNENMWATLDNMCTYTSKCIEYVEIIGAYDVFDVSEVSGERFENWQQVAFENMNWLYREVVCEHIYDECEEWLKERIQKEQSDLLYDSL